MSDQHARRSLWVGLLLGILLMVAAAYAYNLGYRSGREDVLCDLADSYNVGASVSGIEGIDVEDC